MFVVSSNLSSSIYNYDYFYIIIHGVRIFYVYRWFEKLKYIFHCDEIFTCIIIIMHT